MRKFAALMFLVLSFCACKKSKEEKIARRWEAVSVESPQLTELIGQQRAFLDTVGKSTTPDENEELYGVRNIDSLKQVLGVQIDSFTLMQAATIKNTWLDFNKNGSVAASFGNGVDTVDWYFDDEGALMLDEMKRKGTGDKIKMEVIQLEDTILQLRFNENGYSSTATFRPARGEK